MPLELDLKLHCCNTTCQKERVPDNIILHPIAFASKSLTQEEQRYSNIERKVLAYYMAWKNFIIIVLAEGYLSSPTTNHWYPCLKKMLPHCCSIYSAYCAKIHQYRVWIIYKPGPEIFIADWLSQHNHIKGKDKPIKDMDIKVDAIRIATDILACVSISQIQQASAQNEHLQCLKSFIITGWPSTKDELHADLKPNWSYRDELAIIDRVMLKGRHILVPKTLKQQVSVHLHTNHMSIEKLN